VPPTVSRILFLLICKVPFNKKRCAYYTLFFIGKEALSAKFAGKTFSLHALPVKKCDLCNMHKLSLENPLCKFVSKINNKPENSALLSHFLSTIPNYPFFSFVIEIRRILAYNIKNTY
jgi:hypothetical protein